LGEGFKNRNCPEFMQAGAFLGRAVHLATGGFQSANPGLPILRPLDFFFHGFNAKVETRFILITSGDLHRLAQLCDDLMEVRPE
jgi:hypothetical protein